MDGYSQHRVDTDVVIIGDWIGGILVTKCTVSSKWKERRESCSSKVYGVTNQGLPNPTKPFSRVCAMGLMTLPVSHIVAVHADGMCLSAIRHISLRRAFVCHLTTTSGTLLSALIMTAGPKTFPPCGEGLGKSLTSAFNQSTRKLCSLAGICNLFALPRVLYRSPRYATHTSMFGASQMSYMLV